MSATLLVAALPLSIEHRRGQFQIVDLVEWTILIAAVMGLHTIVIGHQLDLRTTLIYVVVVCGWLLIGLPLIWAILAPQRPIALVLTFLTVWPLLVAAASGYALIKIQRLGMSTFYILFWPGLMPATVGITATIALNACALRYLGCRWHSGQHHQKAAVK